MKKILFVFVLVLSIPAFSKLDVDLSRGIYDEMTGVPSEVIYFDKKIFSGGEYVDFIEEDVINDALDVYESEIDKHLSDFPAMEKALESTTQFRKTVLISIKENDTFRCIRTKTFIGSEHGTWLQGNHGEIITSTMCVEKQLIFEL